MGLPKWLMLAFLFAMLAAAEQLPRCYRGVVIHLAMSPIEDYTTPSGEVIPGFKSCVRLGDDVEADAIRNCFDKAQTNAVRLYKDGLLIVNASGLIAGAVRYSAAAAAGCASVADYSGKLILPGLMDCHNHFPQIDMEGAFGGDLVGWLTGYTFKTEARYIDPNYAKANAVRLFNMLARSGTTSGLFFNVIFKDAVAAFFEEAKKRNVRMISGPNGMGTCGDP
eukprot:RCo004743